jgi:phosphate transport system protein
MQEHYTNEIEDLKSNLLKMAALVDDQIEKAMRSLQESNLEITKGLKAKELEVDAYDNLIQTQCENILAMFQPVASDLRYLMAIIMINNNLERCGDIAINIAQRVKKTSGHHNLFAEANLIEMSVISRKMVKDAIDSFINMDIDLANDVLAADDRVDALNKEVFRFAVAKMKEDSGSIEPCAHMIVLSRQIERLADHATNIAENLIFYIEAKLVAHKKKLEKRERE